MKRRSHVSLFVFAAIVAGALSAYAQKVEHSGNVSRTATIVAVDHKTRVVTLKDDKGNVEDVECGPEVTRFDELKVGDTVTFSYHAAVVYEIVKAEAGASPHSAEVSAVRGQGPKPSGAITRQQKLTVTIIAIDPAAPSVTVKGPNGHTMTAEVQDKKKLEGLKPGDKVRITFTEALMVTVEAPKP